MSELTPANSDEVVRILEKLEFVRIRQSGSHAVYRHENGKWVTVPMHKGKDLGKGILRKIIKDTGMTVEEFQKLR
ncbi:MAG: type II toxin-antitoxin system HicA family toxin [Chloroflexota bacterium]|nr:type II toxin-antitoxin system HicA family toxin [Chloroflexota bacterium]